MQIYKNTDNTVRFDFILGESSADQLVPTCIVKERFEKEILSKLDEDGAIEVVLGYIRNHNK